MAQTLLEEGRLEPVFPWERGPRAAEATIVSHSIFWARGSCAAEATIVSRYHLGCAATRAAEATIGKPQSPLERGDPRGRSHNREAAISSWIWSCNYYDIILLAIWYTHAAWGYMYKSLLKRFWVKCRYYTCNGFGISSIWSSTFSTVDSIVSEKLCVFICCNYMRVYYIHTFAHTCRLFFMYPYCWYIYVRFPYLGHASSVRVFGNLLMS